MQCFKHVAKIYSMMFKQLPTMISELNKLGIALKALDRMNLATVGVNTGNLDAFRSAIKGLSIEQAVFALASKGATEEQIRQILITKQSEAADVEAALAKAGLTTATSALTQAEMVELATKTGVAKADAEALLSKIGITAAEEGQVAVKHQVTMAMLEQAVANGTLTSAEKGQIATMLGLNAAETSNIGITNILTGAITKLWAVITAHPIGAILTAVGAVTVGVIAYINKSNKDAQKAIVETHEKAQQALDNTKTALSDDKSELKSVNSELDSTKQKIQDIASQGTITLTEQNELDKLSTANIQLETQKSLLENNIKLKQKTAALDAKKLLDTQVEMDYSDIQDGKDIISHKESYTYAEHAEYEANKLMNAYNIYMSALKTGNTGKQKLAQELIDEVGGDTAKLTSSLLEIVESFKYDDGTIIEGYEDLYDQYMGLIYNLQSLTNPEMFLDIAKQVTEGTNIDYEKAISDGYAMAYDGEFDIDKLNQDFVKALADNGIDESTIEYIFKLKQQEYQLAIDKIDSKYKVATEIPDMIPVKQITWNADGSTSSEYVNYDVDEETKNYIREVNKINQVLNDYAKQHPIEFQLITSYDENFSTLDKYIEEEKSKGDSVDYIDNAINRLVKDIKKSKNVISPETLSDIFSLKDANDTLTTLGKISESIDTIQNAYNTLKSAIDEYNNSGSISINTLQSIVALGDDWYDYLLDENGALKLDKESLQKLTVSRLADMKAQIQQNMIDNVKNITDDASAKEYLTSTNYKTADSIEAVTEAMIEQTLAQKRLLVDSGDLSQENYDLIEKKLRGDIEKNNLLFSKISLDDVSLGGGSGSGSGSGSSSSKSSNTKIDFIEYRLKELEELANKVQSSIDEAVNAGDKNALLGQMQTVDNAKIDTYNKAISYYQKEASNYLEKIPAELREAAKNGAIAITEFIGDNSSEIADYIQQYRDLDNSIAEATEQVSSLRQEVIKLEKEKFDNIVNAFDSIGNIISSNKSIIESQITYLETSGERIGKGYYTSLKDQSKLYLEQLNKERDVLNKQLSTAMSNGVKYGSDEWKDMYSSIQNVDQAIIDTKNDIEGYNNSLRELDWTVFDDAIESIDTISNKLSNLLDLLKTDKVSGDFSGYSKDAITSMSLNAQKMQTANYVIEKTNKEIANLKASYNKGELSVSEYTERLESLENTLWDNISTYNSAKEAIIEIAKARINEEVEAIEKVTEANNERISKLKEELQAEKDLQSYKRSLLEKQNDVSKLQAQINARMGSTDAETIAEREKLEQELADKLKEIKEMQEDQAYDDMMDSLDKEQTAFEEAQQKKIDTLNDSLKNTETLYNNMLNIIFNNTSITYNKLNELSNQYGFILEQNITSPWAKGNMSSNTFRDTVYRNLNGVSDKFTQLQAKADSISFSKLNSQLGSLNLSTLSTMVSLLSSQVNVSGITTGIGNIKSAIENLSKTFETSTKKADDAIKKYGELDKAKKGNNFWVFKTLASYGSHDLARSHLSEYSSYGDVSVIEYGGKSLIVKWLKGYPTSGQASYNVGMSNGSGYYQRYKRGGEITENQNLDVIARSMGEDHIATIAYKEGERILTPEQNKAFLKMVDFSDLIAKSNIIKPFLPSNLSPVATPSLQIGTLLNVEGSIDKNVLPDLQKMLDRSKAEIFNEFGQMLKNKNGCRPR